MLANGRNGFEAVSCVHVDGTGVRRAILVWHIEREGLNDPAAVVCDVVDGCSESDGRPAFVATMFVDEEARDTPLGLRLGFDFEFRIDTTPVIAGEVRWWAELAPGDGGPVVVDEQSMTAPIADELMLKL